MARPGFEPTTSRSRSGCSTTEPAGPVRNPQHRDWGSLFKSLVWSGEGGTAIRFATRLHGICNASHNRVEEGAHLGHLSYRPAPQLWTGDKCPPPCFRVLFGKVQQCCISRDQTTGDLKSHHLQAGVTALSVPPPHTHTLFFQQYMKKVVFFLRALLASSGGGGGGHVPLRPPLGPAL